MTKDAIKEGIMACDRLLAIFKSEMEGLQARKLWFDAERVVIQRTKDGLIKELKEE